MQALYVVKLLYPGTQYNGHCTTCISHTSYHFIWKNFLQASSNIWVQYGSVPPHFIGHKVLEWVMWMPLNWLWGLMSHATPLTALDLLWLPILMLHEGAGVSGDIADRGWAPAAHHAQCRSYTKQSWQPTGSNTCCF